MAGVVTRHPGVDPITKFRIQIQLLETSRLRDAVVALLGGVEVQSVPGLVELSIRPVDGGGWALYLRDPRASFRAEVVVEALPAAEAGRPGRDVRDPHPAPDRWKTGDDRWELFNCVVTFVGLL